MRLASGAAGIAAVLLCAGGALAQSGATISGTEGDDVLVGTAANDALYGAGGNDRLDGAGGDDQLDGGAGADDLRGGPGIDTVVYGGSVPVKASIDGVANDGVEGEGDRIADDVEAVSTGAGADALSGAAGDEQLDGGAGDDAIDGDDGEDSLFGGAGDDTINAVDGFIDVVDCGDGRDLASVDEIDRVTNCETVVRAAQPRVRAVVAAAWQVGGDPTRTRALRITLTKVPEDGVVELRCSPRRLGCRSRRRGVVITRGTGNAARALLGARLRRGAVVEVRISQPGAIGQVVRYRIRGRSGPSRRNLCLRAGSDAASAC